MRKNIGIKPAIYPEPALLIGTYDKNNNPDCMVAAWGGISDDEEVFLCLANDHKTTENILLNKGFTLSSGEAKYVKEIDYLGIVSANKKEDKISKVGFHTHKSSFVNAPIIDEFRYTLECELISYDKDSCHLFGRIKNISVDESVLVNGKVDYKKLDPICYDPYSHAYIRLGDAVGQAFKDGLEIDKK